MRHRIRKLLAERTTMLTALSHDLRTPLTRLKLRCEKLTGNDAIEASANLMLLDIERMEQMLAETLAYLRDESQSEVLVAVDLASLIQTICTQETDLGGSIQYIGPSKLVYRCKPSSITRAVCNLTDNAAKHGTATKVCLEEMGGVVQIDVIDNGPGIPFSERRRVFDPFFKRDWSRGSGGKGFGLGLSIVKQIIESHGGSIELRDSLPHGLDVRIRLPRVTEPPNALAGSGL
jgi:signal transduction histidine kinase